MNLSNSPHYVTDLCLLIFFFSNFVIGYLQVQDFYISENCSFYYLVTIIILSKIFSLVYLISY